MSTGHIGLKSMDEIGLNKDHITGLNDILLIFKYDRHTPFYKQNDLIASMHMQGEGKVTIPLYSKVIGTNLVLQLIERTIHTRLPSKLDTVVGTRHSPDRRSSSGQDHT